MARATKARGARKRASIRTASPRQVPNDLLDSTDANFRPADPQIGPDGALYFADWHNALIGHVQYSQRDPARDHQHGRIYRLIYKGKPLLTPVTQFGRSVPELLDQLREYEPRTRDRARRELRDRPAAEVVAAVNAWVAKLDPKDTAYDRLLCEALWVQQGHHAVNAALLAKVLRAKTGDARAAATRVLADEWERIPNAMSLLKPQIADEFPRTRLEAMRALSFVPTKEAVEAVLLAANQPGDYWLNYTFNATLMALAPVWKDELQKGTIATDNPKGLARLKEVAELSKPGGTAVLAVKRYVAESDLSKQEKGRLLIDISRGKGNAGNGHAIYSRVCAACHKVGAEGTEYGPDLTDVGTRLKRPEIAESILEPNAKIAKGLRANQPHRRRRPRTHRLRHRGNENHAHGAPRSRRGAGNEQRATSRNARRSAKARCQTASAARWLRRSSSIWLSSSPRKRRPPPNSPHDSIHDNQTLSAQIRVQGAPSPLAEYRALIQSRNSIRQHRCGWHWQQGRM